MKMLASCSKRRTKALSFLSKSLSLSLPPSPLSFLPLVYSFSLCHDPWGMGIFTRQIQILIGTRDPTLPLSIPVHVLISTPSHPVFRPLTEAEVAVVTEWGWPGGERCGHFRGQAPSPEHAPSSKHKLSNEITKISRQ